MEVIDRYSLDDEAAALLAKLIREAPMHRLVASECARYVGRLQPVGVRRISGKKTGDKVWRERRVRNARRAAAALHASRTAEQRREVARRAGLASQAAKRARRAAEAWPFIEQPATTQGA